ncbi:hypothetical protein GCM10023321_01310 [Pseudonocardia eucalypti]|uniref:DUF2029 domain-containing protein n=1 Tax=Pseudonocardia eucalypti TaxID=648755 RepID=A0ABP9PD26_9PSEU|nr:hypothetical protein [Pseudonocardia eucalypti]
MRRLGASGLLLVTLLCWLTMVVSYQNKARCVGPTYDSYGRTEPAYQVRKDRDVCYSDVQHLWIGRDIDRHVFPYVHGGIDADGSLYGGAVEYPVLTGLLMWTGALFAHTDGAFLLGTALLLAPFGLLVGYLLAQLAGWRSLLWAVGPPLFLYAFHNWDLPAVAATVAAVWVMHRPGSASVARRGCWAGVLLGLGFAFKLYPAMFLAPLALYVLTASRPRYDWGGTLRVLGSAAATVIAVNLPFALFGYRGWLAAFTFQGLRKVDLTTNSIWYWGFRPHSDPENAAFQAMVDWASPAAVLVSFAVALGIGWWRYRRDGVYPWIPVSAAMLAGFLLLHKVHSPQYALWILPFFALLRVRWGWIAGYFLADLAIGIGIFRYFYVAFTRGTDYEIYSGLAAQAVIVGVWGRAALLVALFGVFLFAEACVPSATRTPAAPGDQLASAGPAAPAPGTDRAPLPSGHARTGSSAAAESPGGPTRGS